MWTRRFERSESLLEFRCRAPEGVALWAVRMLASWASTSGQGILDSFNQTGGVDTRLVFFKDWFVGYAHMAGTQSPGSPSRKQRPWSCLDVPVQLGRRDRGTRKIGPNFNPEVGFIERSDSNETYGDMTFKVRPSMPGRSGNAIRGLPPSRP